MKNKPPPPASGSFRSENNLKKRKQNLHIQPLTLILLSPKVQNGNNVGNTGNIGNPPIYMFLCYQSM